MKLWQKAAHDKEGFKGFNPSLAQMNCSLSSIYLRVNLSKMTAAQIEIVIQKVLLKLISQI